MSEQTSAAQSAPAGERETIRAVFLRNGFTVKEGQTDLKPYVYAAAEELLSIARAAWQRTQSAASDSHDFKNFHRLLCERFGYAHDEKDWRRDQLSLIEWIAKQSAGVPEQIDGLCASMNIIDTLQRPGMSLRDLEAVNGEKNVLANKVRKLIARYAAAPATPAAQGAVPDVSAMARVLSDRSADACNIDRDDNWAMYGQEYIEDVRAMLAASTGQEVK